MAGFNKTAVDEIYKWVIYELKANKGEREKKREKSRRNKPESQDKDALGKIEHLSYIY